MSTRRPRRPFRVSWVLLALLLPAVAGAGLAAHSQPCPPFTVYVPVDAESRTYPAYFTLDEVNSHGYVTFWIYAESNGISGLQRDDDSCYTPGTTYSTMDTIIF